MNKLAQFFHHHHDGVILLFDLGSSVMKLMDMVSHLHSRIDIG